MGADKGAEVILRGALQGAKQYGVDLTLFGDEATAKKVIKEFGDLGGADIKTVDVQTFIEMTDSPAVVNREKKDCSMTRALRCVLEGEADAVVSAGNTGALFTASSLILRRVKGVRRAALAGVIPLEKPFVVVDSGANIDVTPENLLQFAIMGSAYAENVLNIKSPRVALLNNGAEESKGTPIYTETYKLLKDSSLNFIGNCEGRDLPFGACDVLVCDGFTGNIAVKTIEGMGAYMKKQLKGLFANVGKIAGLLVWKRIDALKNKVDHRVYGGAPFLGITKPVVKAHGSSDEVSICACIKQARDYCESGIIEKFTNAINQQQ